MIKKTIFVPSYKRKVKGRTQHVRSFYKRKRKGKKRIIGAKPVRLYPVRDEHGQWKGWSAKRG